MASGTIDNPFAVANGSVTAASGFTISKSSVQKVGNICLVSFSVDGSFPVGGNAYKIATLAQGFKPVAVIETALLSSSSWVNALYKAQIYTNGEVLLQGKGSTAAAWVNVVAAYIAR